MRSAHGSGCPLLSSSGPSSTSSRDSLPRFSASPRSVSCWASGRASTGRGPARLLRSGFPARKEAWPSRSSTAGRVSEGPWAALVIPLIALAFGWRSAFIFSGLLGFIWLLVWLKVYHPLDKHPSVTKEEVSLIRAGQEVRDESTNQGVARWEKLFKDRNVWGIVLGRALTDPIWWFYVFWLPQYLSDARGLSLHRIAMVAWMPFVAADLGNFTGGFISGYCIRRGSSVIQARLWVCVISCIPILVGIPAAAAHNVYTALGLVCFALWGYASWSTMGLTLPSDLFPQEVVATVTGLSGLAAGLVSAVFTMLVGIVVDRFSYGPAFIAAGLLPIFATLFLLVLIRRPSSIEPQISR